MKIISECLACKRQYDASHLKPGGSFRCQCGSSIVVKAPVGSLDVTVICCSACGGPKETDSESCVFCRATFTLFARDMNTVCPHCYGRVGDEAKFCHRCGTAIDPQEFAGLETEFSCPHCEPSAKLKSRQLKGTTTPLLECDNCGGMWVGHDHFQNLQRKVQTQSVIVLSEPVALNVKNKNPAATFRYRKCPVCQTLMNRKNFAGCGVITDTCQHHGVWFDENELTEILNWIGDGHLSQKLTEKEQDLKALERKIANQKLDAQRRDHGRPFQPSGNEREDDVILSALFGFFKL